MYLSQPTPSRRAFVQTLCAGALSVAALPKDAFSKQLELHAQIDGQWLVRLDPNNLGTAQSWFADINGRHAQLPNGLNSVGIGEMPTVKTVWTGTLENRDYYTEDGYAPYREPNNVKVPFFLQPETYYAGIAWYQREITIPETWREKRVELYLERAHWETQVWLDDEFMGRCESLSTPHCYDLGQLSPGTYRLTIRVDNSLIQDIGVNSHAITDHTQGNWNGIVGNICLRATNLTWLDDVQLYPDATSRTVRVVVNIKTLSGKSGRGTLELVYGGQKTRIGAEWTKAGGRIEETVKFPADAALWDEFSPNLHAISARLGSNEPVVVRFGFRDVSITSSHVTINGRPTFIRGTLECAIFPETGYPPTDKEAWRRIFKIARSFGLNMMRFHSYCPPSAAFEAADEEGFYCQVETCWANSTTTLGDGKPVDKWVKEETDRILKAYGNHPSFVFMLYGNEPGGQGGLKSYLSEYVRHYKGLDGRRLWSSGAGWPELPENQFHVVPEPRIQRWGEGLKSRVNASPPDTSFDYSDFVSQRTVPVISHEAGEWCAYPDFDEMPQYTGYLKPKNFEIFKERLKENGLENFGRDFLMASGRLQTLLYKEEIESALRTPDMGGFQLLDLHDFPGQGTALVGVLNPFWKEKGYVTAAEFHRFCSETVILARLQKRVFTSSEVLIAKAEITHFGPADLGMVCPYWSLISEDKTIASGILEPVHISVGAAQSLGEIKVNISEVKAAASCKLIIGVEALQSKSSRKFENDWDVWVYPHLNITDIGKVVVTSSVEDAINIVSKGKAVILSLPPEKVRNFEKHPVKFGFSTIFWNTSWTNRQAPTTLGVFCDPGHPALRDFPTDVHSNWQWWYIVHRAAPLRGDLLPENSKSIVRVIDDWFTARNLPLIAEFKCGSGKLLLCGFDLTNDAINDPVSMQLRFSLEKYVLSSELNPQISITPSELRSISL